MDNTTYLVTNSFKNDKWGSHRKESGIPISLNEPFEMYITIDKQGYRVQVGTDVEFNDDDNPFDFLDEIPIEEEKKEKEEKEGENEKDGTKKDDEKKDEEKEVSWTDFKTLLQSKDPVRGYSRLTSSEWIELGQFLGNQDSLRKDWISKLKTALPVRDKWADWGKAMAESINNKDGAKTATATTAKQWRSGSFSHKVKDQIISRLSLHNVVLESIQIFEDNS